MKEAIVPNRRRRSVFFLNFLFSLEIMNETTQMQEYVSSFGGPKWTLLAFLIF